MGLHISAVQRDGAADAALLDQGSIDALPDPAPRPAIEAVVDRGVGAVFDRAIAPAAARLQDVDDSADDAAVIDPASTRLITGQKRLDHRPGIIAEPEQFAHELVAPIRGRFGI
jgi:hypothetical protein